MKNMCSWLGEPLLKMEPSHIIVPAAFLKAGKAMLGLENRLNRKIAAGDKMQGSNKV